MGTTTVGADTTTRLWDTEIARIAEDAYIFGFPLVLMDVTRAVQTAVAESAATKAPMNQWCHFRAFPDASFTDVASPSADTLDSIAWLDLSNEPMIVRVPDMGQRYYVVHIMDAWSNVFANPGSRTTGTAGADFAIVGPRWVGKLPDGVKEVRSPTTIVWVINRMQTTGKDDYDAVHALQDQYGLTPLSVWGKSYTPPVVRGAGGVDTKTPPAEQVEAMPAAIVFSRLNALMKENPPAAIDAEAMKRFAVIDVAPGNTFSLSPGIEQGVGAARERIAAEARKPFGKSVNNWSVLTKAMGRWGNDYLFRARMALIGLGASLPEDAVCPLARLDADGAPLTGARRYVLRFPKGQLPPVGAFWSVTMYNAKQAFVANPIDRYAIGDRDALTSDADGSVTIYIQHDSPGADKASNWLPAPAGEFNLAMRLHWPLQVIFSGAWRPPRVERAR